MSNYFQSFGVVSEHEVDDHGAENYNQDLSEKRSEAIVVEMMLRIKIPGIRYVAKGLGETSPVDSNDTDSGRQKNRRVEIIVENADDFY